MEAVLRAIVDPRRREIIRLVRSGERSAGEIASHFDISRPAVSQHLAILRDAGLVTERRHGNRRLYRARPEAMADVRAYVEEFWTDHLSVLRIEAEKDNNSQ